MTELEWREPPPRSAGPKYAEQARALRENPGRPLLIKSYAHELGDNARSMAQAVRRGSYGAFRPAGAFDAETHTEEKEDGTPVVNVYVRFVGDGARDS